MKIAYLIAYDINLNDGVTKKVKSQAETWRNCGEEVEIFAIVPECGVSDIDARQYQSLGALNQRVFQHKALVKDITLFNPDVIYYRYDVWSASLSKLMKKFKVIAELNTNVTSEMKLWLKKDKSIKSLLRYLAYSLFSSLLLKKLTGLVAVTSELAQDKSYLKHVKNVNFFPNSIDLTTHKTIKTNDNGDRNSRTSLFFIGTPDQDWHGIDIIEEMASKLPEYDFHIVGISKKNYSNLFYHGVLPQREYVKILEKCHICIGTLALHRKNLSEASPLKLREYLAYGYPTILGYQDTAFLDMKEPKWILRINSQASLDINSIKEFVELNKRIIVQHQFLDEFSSRTVEFQRLNFFKKVCT